MEEMVRQTDQLINFTREINRRIGESGISGVEGLVALYDQLRNALSKVSQQELDWAQGEVNRVLDSLKRLSDELNHLAALTAAAGAAGEQAGGEQGEPDSPAHQAQWPVSSAALRAERWLSSSDRRFRLSSTRLTSPCAHSSSF